MADPLPSQDDILAEIIGPNWVAVPVDGPWCRECGHLWRDGDCQEAGCPCRHSFAIVAANPDGISLLDIDYS